MSDYFPFWMFCSVVAICITVYHMYVFSRRHK